MTDTVLARLAELKTIAIPDLNTQWRELFHRAAALQWALLESRRAYRIQELAYGGLKPQAIERLKALGEQLDGGYIAVRRVRGDDRPIAGTRLIREWQRVDHTVTALADGYEWQGRPENISALIRQSSVATNPAFSRARRDGARGRQPATVTTRDLIRPLPALWDAQQNALLG